MDIDAMTIEQRNEMMRKGLCFICEKPGHLGRNCPTKGQPSNNRKPPSYASTWKPTTSTPKKMTGKELHTHIRGLVTQMEEEEKEKFYDEADKEGF